MKKNVCFLILLITCLLTSGQQLINHIFDPSAFAIRGIAIPGMLTSATILKNKQSKTIIPAIIKEEKTQLSKWKKTVFGNVNTLNALSIASRVLISSIELKGLLEAPPVLYAPGFRETKRKYEVLKKRTERLELRVIALLGIGTLFIDGEGYYRVASQRLAIEYLDVYSELSKIDFKLTKLITFIGLLPKMVN